MLADVHEMVWLLDWRGVSDKTGHACGRKSRSLRHTRDGRSGWRLTLQDDACSRVCEPVRRVA